MIARDWSCMDELMAAWAGMSQLTWSFKCGSEIAAMVDMA